MDRLLPSDEAEDLIALTRDIADKVLDPIVDAHEKAETYPDGVFAQLGAAGLLSLPQPEEWGGGGQPYEVYLQVLEEIAARWAAVAVAVSVHSLSSHPLLAFGTDEQKQRWLPGMLSGEQIGAYSLSEPQAGSDAAALRCAATKTDDGYVINGSKSWITHGGRADFYTLFARTGEGSRGISCFLIPGDLDGLSFGKPEEKMGLHAVPTTSAFYDNAAVDADRRIGDEGQGLQIAFSALDSGRLGIAAVAVGLAQAALDEATALRQRANDVRPQDHRPPGPGVRAGRHGGGGGECAGDISRRRAQPRSRQAVFDAGQRRQADRHRRRDEGDHRRRPGVSAASATPATSASSATCARPRSPRSSRAPTRFSDSSSPTEGCTAK